MEPITLSKPDAIGTGPPVSKAPSAKEAVPRQKVEKELNTEHGKQEQLEPKEAVSPKLDEMPTSKLMDKLNREMSLLVRETDLEFELEKSENRVVVRVYEKDSGKLLREIPPSEVEHLSKDSLDGKGRLLSQAI